MVCFLLFNTLYSDIYKDTFVEISESNIQNKNHKDDCQMELVFVKGGSFTMLYRDSVSSKPLDKVIVSSFYIGKSKRMAINNDW
jgi:formylglycine-generating enzyme required for sulfatase activity